MLCGRQAAHLIRVLVRWLVFECCHCLDSFCFHAMESLTPRNSNRGETEVNVKSPLRLDGTYG